MTDTQEKIEGTLSAVTFVGESKGKWKRYNVVFSDGTEHRVITPPDYTGELKIGETCRFYKGTYNSWVIDQEKGEQEKEGAMSRNDYFKAKDEYERLERDPKIEFQEYFKIVTSFYASAIPTLKNPPKGTEELDNYIDDAYAKAQAIYNLRQKKD